MGVPKGRRKQSQFEAIHNYYKLRAEIVDLLFREFGFSEKKYNKTIERYRTTHEKSCDTQEKIDEVVERYENRLNNYQEWFIIEERTEVLKIIRQIGMEFTWGNSIFPGESSARQEEFIERRKHMNNAIALAYVLKQEINFVICTLPVDINTYKHYEELIDKQIALMKGVRKADNRFSKPVDPHKYDKIKEKRKKSKKDKSSSEVSTNTYQDIPTYQQLSTYDAKTNVAKPQGSLNNNAQFASSPVRVPNTSKMNTSRFGYNQNMGQPKDPRTLPKSYDEFVALNRK